MVNVVFVSNKKKHRGLPVVLKPVRHEELGRQNHGEIRCGLRWRLNHSGGGPCVFRAGRLKKKHLGSFIWDSCFLLGGLNWWNWLNLMQISSGQFLEGFPLSRSVGVGNDPLCGFKWRSYWKNIWEHEWWWVFNTKIEGKSGELRASVAMRQIWVVCLRFRLLYDIYNRLNTCQFPAVVSSRSTTKFRRLSGRFGGFWWMLQWMFHF